MGGIHVKRISPYTTRGEGKYYTRIKGKEAYRCGERGDVFIVYSKSYKYTYDPEMLKFYLSK